MLVKVAICEGAITDCLPVSHCSSSHSHHSARGAALHSQSAVVYPCSVTKTKDQVERGGWACGKLIWYNTQFAHIWTRSKEISICVYVYLHALYKVPTPQYKQMDSSQFWVSSTFLSHFFCLLPIHPSSRMCASTVQFHLAYYIHVPAPTYVRISRPWYPMNIQKVISHSLGSPPPAAAFSDSALRADMKSNRMDERVREIFCG